MYAMFQNCRELKYIDLSNFNTSNVVYMNKLFLNCFKLEEIKGLNNFDTTNVKFMDSMFEECYELKSLDLSNFNVSNVTDMGYMFNKCVKLKEIKGLKFWNTNNVLIMSEMFKDCHELEYLDLSNFNTSNVIYMNGMFNKCYKLKKIKGINKFDLTNALNLYKMFRGCFKLKEVALQKFYTSKINNKSIELISQINEKLSDIALYKLDGEYQYIPEEQKCSFHFITIDQLIKYSVSCNNSDIFKNISKKLYLEFPSLKTKNLCFIVNGNVINPSASIKENRIKNNNVILIYEDE